MQWNFFIIRHLQMFQYWRHLHTNDLYLWIWVTFQKHICNLQDSKTEKSVSNVQDIVSFPCERRFSRHSFFSMWKKVLYSLSVKEQCSQKLIKSTSQHMYTWVHPKILSIFSDKQLSTIRPTASFVKLRQNDISKLNKFLERLASDTAVLWATYKKSQFPKQN